MPNLGSLAIKLFSVGLLPSSPTVKKIALEEALKNVYTCFDDNVKKVNPDK